MIQPRSSCCYVWARSLNLDGQPKLKPNGNSTSPKIDFSGRQAIDPDSAHTPRNKVLQEVSGERLTSNAVPNTLVDAGLHAREQAREPRATQHHIASNHATPNLGPRGPADAHARMYAAGAGEARQAASQLYSAALAHSVGTTMPGSAPTAGTALGQPSAYHAVGAGAGPGLSRDAARWQAMQSRQMAQGIDGAVAGGAHGVEQTSLGQPGVVDLDLSLAWRRRQSSDVPSAPSSNRTTSSSSGRADETAAENPCMRMLFLPLRTGEGKSSRVPFLAETTCISHLH